MSVEECPMITLSAFADEISADPAEQLECLTKNGIRHIEFRSIFGTNVLDLDPRQHAAFRDLLRSNGFALSAIGSPIGKVSIGDPFDPHLRRHLLALELAEYYGVKRVRVFSFYVPTSDDPANHRAEVLRRMSTMAAMAAERGLTLVLENERGIYGDTASRVLDILQAVDSPALGHAFDPANYLEVGQSIDDAWKLLRSRTIHFHVKDYDTETKKNVPCGYGQGQVANLIADAVAHGFDGYCTLEPHLLVAEQSRGFTGPERFGEATVALKSALDAHQVKYS